MKLNIWDDDCIESLDENNQKCIWCDNKFQVINDTKDISHVLVTKDVYTNSCFAAIGTYHPTRYQYLKHLKAARKGVIKDYSENINPYISCFQNKSYTVIESSIHHNPKSIPSSNFTNI